MGELFPLGVKSSIWAVIGSVLLPGVCVFKARAMMGLSVYPWTVAQGLAQGVIYRLADGIDERHDLYVGLAQRALPIY